MIVVSNTSPLTNLAAIGQFNLLRAIYGQIHIPNGVWEELNSGGRQWPGSREVSAADWVQTHPVTNQQLVHALRRDLDKGEAECIALAIELQADTVLIDEREARRSAQRYDLAVAGILAVLIEAKRQKHLPAIRPLLNDLRTKAGFRISDSLFQLALTRANE